MTDRAHNPILDKKLSEATVEELLGVLGFTADQARAHDEARKQYIQRVDAAMAKYDWGSRAFMFSEPEVFTNMQDFHNWVKNVMKLYNENPRMKFLVAAAMNVG
jgi:hypothetical protein